MWVMWTRNIDKTETLSNNNGVAMMIPIDGNKKCKLFIYTIKNNAMKWFTFDRFVEAKKVAEYSLEYSVFD